MLKNQHLKKQKKYTTLQKEEIREFGIYQLGQTVARRQPLFCHSWDGQTIRIGATKSKKTPFNDALQKAYCALMTMDIQSEAQDYPAAVQQLRHYVFVKGTKVTCEEFGRMLLTYKNLVEHRAEHWREKYQEPSEIRLHERKLKLCESNKGFWGSRQQWACGAVISRLLCHFGVTESGNDLHPVFAILLYPLGGIAGSGNMSWVTGDMHTSVSVHAIVHDAFGYVDKAHDVGASYNYLAADPLFANDNPFCCQAQGVLEARRVLMREGLLGDKGRSKRELEMVACRKALSSGEDREIDYPEGSLPTEEEIKADYASRRNNFTLESFGRQVKQLMLNVHMKMWKWKDPAVSPNAQTPVSPNFLKI